MIGIYKITNKINNKCYIGASKNIERRWLEHKRGDNKNSLLYSAFKKYGKENFSYEIIEQCSLEELYKREVYWIDFFQSFKNGYNLNSGGVGGGAPGEHNGMSTLTEKDVIFIREAYKNNESKIETFRKYFYNKITFSGFSSVWQGKTWKHIMPEIYTQENINKHVHRSLKGKVNLGVSNNKAKLKEKEVLEIISLLISSTTPQIEIAKQFNVSENTIGLINRCKTWTHLHNYKNNIRLNYGLEKNNA